MNMRIALAFVAGLVLPCAALAQGAPGKLYQPVAAGYDVAAEDDAALADLVKSLRAATQKSDVSAFEAAMSPGFVALECSASPLKPCGPGRGKAIGGKGGKPLDRMRLAFCCEGNPKTDTPAQAQNETLFAVLSATFAANSIGGNPDAKGWACVPALPAFDRAKAAKAAKAAGVEPENLRVANADIPLFAKPERGAAATGKLAAGDLAPIVTDLTSDTPAGWTAIGLPDGGIGYTNALGLEELTPAAICFGKEKGQWRIVSTIQRG